MAGPWERYGAASEDEAASEGPWTRYSAPGAGPQSPMQTATNAMRTFNNWLLPGLGATYEGAVDAGAAALRGDDALSAFRAGRAENEAGQADLRARNPALSVGAATAGGIIPGLLSFGATTATQAANQVTQTLSRSPFMNFLRDAATGAAVNAPVGAITSIDRPENIGAATLEAGAHGAVLAPAIRAVAAPLFGALDAATNRAPRVSVDPNAVGMSGGNVRVRPAPPRTVREGVSNNIIRLARRERLTPARVDETMAAHNNAGQAPILAQVLGEAGLQRGQTLASVPGQTPRLAADTIRRRNTNQRDLLERSFEQVAPGRNRSPTVADEALNAERQRVNREAFTPALNERPNPAQAGRINQILGRFPLRVLERANQTIDELAHVDGLDPASISQGRRLYYTKRALSNTIEEMSREGLGSDMRGAYERLSREYVGALQEAMPGLQPAMQRFEQVARARDALAAGQKFMRQSIDDLDRTRRTASEIEREYAEVGWREYVEGLLDRNRDGRNNLAELFSSDGFRRRTEALLGEERARPLLEALRTRADDFRDMASLTPRAGAKTAPIFADLADQGQAVPQTRAGWINAALQAVRNPLAEHARNIEGRALFQEMTPERAMALKQALIDAGIRVPTLGIAAPTAAVERPR